MSAPLNYFIVQDHKENRLKCTLTPLKKREGLTFLRLGPSSRQAREVEVPGGVLLHIDGPGLTRSDAELLAGGSLVLVDSTWARVPSVLARLKVAPGARLERRSLPEGLITAYPRASKLYRDPRGGLASVEALFVAALILGEPDPDLLQGYRWAREFLEWNQDKLAALSPNIALFFPILSTALWRRG